MATLGEEAGNLEKSLFRVAETYEKEVEQSIRLFTSLIEPIMILVVGSAIAFLLFSMLLSIRQLFNNPFLTKIFFPCHHQMCEMWEFTG